MLQCPVMNTHRAHTHAWLALRASAGSGKTFALTLRYIALLFEGAKPAHILTLTFTKKAAAEMRERIHKTLACISVAARDYKQDPTHQPDSKTQEFLDVLQKDYNLSLERLALLDAPAIYAHFLQENPPITTIDAFFQKVLRKFSYFVGVGAQFSVGECPLDEQINAFLNRLSPEDMHRLRRFCFLLLAHSGSFSAAHALKNFLDLYYSGLCFNSPKPPSTDLKQLEQEIFEEYRAIKIPRQREIRTFKDVLEVLKNVGAQKAISANPALKAKIVEYFNAKEAAIFNEFAYFLKLYQERSHDPNRLNFPAITLKVHHLLRENVIDKDFFYFRLDGQIEHILIDEFQDTNDLQFGILEPLIEEIKAGVGQKWGERSVFFVGDSKQSIYGFRGSKSALFESVCAKISSQSLEHNYRSMGVVLGFVNATFAPKIAGYVVQKLPEQRQDLANKGYVCVQSVGVGAYKDSAQKEEALLNATLQAVQKLLDSGVSSRDITILCFKNDDVNDLKEFLTPHLKGEQIVSAADLSLLAQKEVKALRHALLYALSPAEQQSYHLAHVAKLCGLPLNKPPKLPPLNPHLSAHILNLMQILELYSPSACHFLERSLEFNNPQEFLDFLEQENLQIAQSETVGLKIMTIHKSKGMEFGHAILMDRLSTKSPPNTQKLLQNEQEVFYKQKNREYFDQGYQAALEAHKQAQEQEHTNVLYVACTRAKESLIILQKDTESALASFECQELGRLPQRAPKEAMTALANQSPALLGNQKAFGAQIDKISDFNTEEKGNRPARLFGSALHKALELFYGYKVDLVAIRDYLNHHYSFENVSTKALLKRLEILEQESSFQSLLRGRIATEVSFKSSHQLSKDFLRMDMVVFNNQGLTILDYKSGQGNEAAHRAQVRGYLQKVRALYPQQNAQAFLIYTLKTHVEVQPIKG
ncbi:DNA helicase [Helicobacter ailurogastricus]|nr:DNA helicase [Helicobacter ailurogastricus]